MMTENLAEMVASITTQSGNGMSSEYDIILGHTDQKEELPDVSQREYSSGQELQVTGKSEPIVSEIRSMDTIKMPEVELVKEYQPESEEALIDYVNSQNNKLEMANILVKWEIGRCINSFYQGKYGTNELGKISEATGIGRDTLAKACKFAKQYSKEHLEMLLKGNFAISWTQIAPHLTVEPQKVIETYQVSPDPKQFYYGIIKLKSQSEVRGKSKPPKIVEEKPVEAPIMVCSKIMPVMPYKDIFNDYKEQDKKVDPDELAKQYEAYEKELEMLKLENERLKKEILSRDAKVRELEKKLTDVQREKEKYEDLSYAYMHKLDKVRAELENNTPVEAIIEWMENGADE